MSWVDQEYAIRLVGGYAKYRVVSMVPFKLNARCVVCGDSLSDPNKSRFWVYPTKKDDSLSVKCFNCDYSARFSTYLKEQDPDMYREYLMEKRKENLRFTAESDKKSETDLSKFNKKLIKPIIEKLDFCERLDRLPKNHPIVKYVNNRCIPKTKFKRLWFTTQWPALCNSVKPDTYKRELPEPRLVIPIYNKERKIEAFQGRALRADAAQKYITIKANDDATKIYGLDTVDESKPVFVVEGPIDSLFLSNAIAITGGSLELNVVPFQDNRIWVMDNEPRHEDTIKRMKSLIDQGEIVAFWDSAPWSSKDINDMVKNEKADIKDIEEYLINNSCSGLMAKLRLKKYSKI